MATNAKHITGVDGQDKHGWIAVPFTHFTKVFRILVLGPGHPWHPTFPPVAGGGAAVQRILGERFCLGDIHQFGFVVVPSHSSKRATGVNVTVVGRTIMDEGTTIVVEDLNGRGGRGGVCRTFGNFGGDHGTSTTGGRDGG